jgi:alginate O-acetyltransferase complex protein AlgI
MEYQSSIYLFIFLPAALFAYGLTPKKHRWLTLLLFGYLFFWLISGKLLLILLLTTLGVYCAGGKIAILQEHCKTECNDKSREENKEIKERYKKREKRILVAAILLLLAILVCFKYYNFFIKNGNALLTYFHINLNWQETSIAVPIGISFYTLQAIGYLADVYWGKVNGADHPGKLALFLAFFPQIMEGPISMYSQTAESLFEGHDICFANLRRGCIRILWGLFKKIVIADRVYMAVTTLYNNYTEYYGVMIIVAAIAYTTQLYMEFSGCMDIIIGSGYLFGINLPENFRQPFSSKNAAEFWRRWHITLGAWFKTYIFYPVSMSKMVKKWNKYGKAHVGKYLTKLSVSAMCLFPVWLCNGLWHGARWSYLFYGMYYFVILMLELAIEPARDKLANLLHLNIEAWYYKAFQIVKTWLIIITGELFFRANGLRAGVRMFRSIFTCFGVENLWNGTLLNIGLDRADYLVITAGVIIVALVGILKERKLLSIEKITAMPLPLRWAIYYALILAILILGAYGAGYQQVDMIYAGF